MQIGRADRPPIWRYIFDAANVVTLLGAACAALAVSAALAGQTRWAAALLLWAVLADHMDGVIAVRLRNRAPRAAEIGKHLDSLADMLHGAIGPAVVVLSLATGQIWPTLAAVAIACSATLRLAYFDTFGRDGEGCFSGLPVTYTAPVISGLCMTVPYIPPTTLVGVMTGALAVLAILQIAPLRVPALKGFGYVCMIGYVLCGSILLLVAS